MQTKRIKRSINGVLLLDKPSGITSNAALQHAKRLFQASKAGLTGILDPLASGLLPICFGEATKFAQYPTDADKRYEATIQLGVTTDTGDSQGQILEQIKPVVGIADVQAAIALFIGTILQIPPMYSALKHQGQPLYKYARQGVEIERKAREITIHQITLISFAHDILRISVDCSKGTYIRVLAEDIGRQLGCGAHLSALRRTQVGRFSLDKATALDRLELYAAIDRDQLLLPIDCLVAHLPEVRLVQDEAYYFRLGQSIFHAKLEPLQRYGIYDEKHVFIGIGEADDAGKLAPKRLVVVG